MSKIMLRGYFRCCPACFEDTIFFAPKHCQMILKFERCPKIVYFKQDKLFIPATVLSRWWPLSNLQLFGKYLRIWPKDILKIWLTDFQRYTELNSLLSRMRSSIRDAFPDLSMARCPRLNAGRGWFPCKLFEKQSCVHKKYCNFKHPKYVSKHFKANLT